MHDNPSLYPHLPSKIMAGADAELMLEPVRGTEWEACWEYVLTHQMTESEGSAFWHGANLAHEATKASCLERVEHVVEREYARGGIVFTEGYLGSRQEDTASGWGEAMRQQRRVEQALLLATKWAATGKPTDARHSEALIAALSAHSESHDKPAEEATK